MKVTEAALATDSKAIIDGVLSGNKPADVHRRGRPVVQIRRKVGIGAAELIGRLKQAAFTKAEQRELKAAMDAASETFTHADRH